MNKNYALEERHGCTFIVNKLIRDSGKFTEVFTTRTGGVSDGPYESLNTGFHTGDRQKNVRKNLDKVKRYLGTEKIYAPRQVHGDKIVIVDEDTKTYIKDTEADALITRLKGTAIAVKAADCIGNIIVDPVTLTVAAVHSGWRGVANRIITKTVGVMQKEFGSHPEDLIVSMSPAIAPPSFVVGEDVYIAMQKEPVFCNIFKLKEDGMHMNMWLGNHNLLVEAGVKEDNICINDLNTFTHSKMFFSYRRDGRETGRMMAIVMIK
jgi:YfiH family protein